MIKVKFYYSTLNTQIEKRLFDTYEDFGYWYIKNFNKITLTEIRVDNIVINETEKLEY